jgi:hypothetical protein
LTVGPNRSIYLSRCWRTCRSCGLW